MRPEPPDGAFGKRMIRDATRCAAPAGLIIAATAAAAVLLAMKIGLAAHASVGSKKEHNSVSAPSDVNGEGRRRDIIVSTGCRKGCKWTDPLAVAAIWSAHVTRQVRR
eukprot:Opistho-2@15578